MHKCGCINEHIKLCQEYTRSYTGQLLVSTGKHYAVATVSVCILILKYFSRKKEAIANHKDI